MKANTRVGNTLLELVHEFRYPASIITKENKCLSVVKRGTAVLKSMFYVLANNHQNIDTRKKSDNIFIRHVNHICDYMVVIRGLAIGSVETTADNK